MENVDSIILEHLRPMREKIDLLAGDMREVKHRLATVAATQGTQGTILQHTGHLASSITQRQVGFDRMSERIERIEQRLQLTNA